MSRSALRLSSRHLIALAILALAAASTIAQPSDAFHGPAAQAAAAMTLPAESTSLATR